MKTYHFSSFQNLAQELHRGSSRTFTHRWQDPSYRNSLPELFRTGLPAGWDLPGRSGVSEAPKYLYRGEPGVFASSLSSWGRLNNVGRFDARELELLDQLTDMASENINSRIADPFRAVGWPQHYSFPTVYLDLTSDPAVALHFAASSGGDPPPKKRVVFRIDLEAIERKIYRPAGQTTPLAAACIEHMDFTRAKRQRAWVICARRNALRFNLQWSWHIWGHVEKFTVDATDAESFLHQELLDAQDDTFASWPLAIVRALKIVAGGALPQALAKWICARIPLYEWTPLEVYYDEAGRGTQLGLLSPAQAAKRDGRDYRADPEAVVEEPVSPHIPRPNGIVFGIPTGGKPGTTKWLEPGSECEVQWRSGIPGPNRRLPAALWPVIPVAFERVILR
jgi:hypothetical protein